jgi:hypothetical protein
MTRPTPLAEKIAATKPCTCGALPSVEVDDVSGGCFIECVNKNCNAHLTVAHGGGRDIATQVWNAAALAAAAKGQGTVRT